MTEWIISSSALIIIAIIQRFILKGRIHPGLQAALWGLVLLRLLIR
jgi:beta-lactamase regulating signal transducer with metallopeptidase domain